MDSIGKRLEALRGATTRRDFSAMLGIPVNTLRNYELGISLPNSDLIAKLSQKLRINPRWLILGEEPIYDADTTAPVEAPPSEPPNKARVTYIDPAMQIVNDAIEETGLILTEKQKAAVLEIIREEIKNKTTTIAKAIKGT